MANLVPMPKMQFLDANGNPLAAGKLYSYVGGSINTPLATYTTAAGNVQNTNPVILDSGGWANVWLSSANYKLVLTTSADVEVWSVDNVNGANSATLAALAASSGSTLIGHLPSGSGGVATTVYEMFEREPISIFSFMSEAQRNDVQGGIGSIDVSSATQKAFDKAYGSGAAVRPVTGWGKAKLLTGISARAPIMGMGGAAFNGIGLTFSWLGSGTKVFDFPVYDQGWIFSNFRIDTSGVTSDVAMMYFDTGLNGAIFQLVEFKGYHTGSSWGGTYANHDGIVVVGGSGVTKYDCSNNVLMQVRFTRNRNGFTIPTDPSGQAPGNSNTFIQMFAWCNGWAIKSFGSSNVIVNGETNTESGNHTYFQSGSGASNWSYTGCEFQTAQSGVGNEPIYCDTAGSFDIATIKGGQLLQANGGGFPALVLDAGATGGKIYRYSTEGVNNVDSTAHTIDQVILGQGLLFNNGGSMSGAWTTPTFSAGNFTGNGAMTVTVIAGQVATYEYFYSGKMMTVNFAINNFSVGGTPNTQIRIKIPNSSVAAKQTTAYALIKDASTWGNGFCTVDAAGTNILIFSNPNGSTNWSASVESSSVQGSITFEVQ